MKLTGKLCSGILAIFLASPQAYATDSLTEAQKKEVEKVVHDYLIANPEVLVEVSQVLQKKQQQTAQSQAKAAIIANANQLFTDKLAVAGNPNGNVTLVEFFDYQCIHCKKMKPIVSELVKKNSNLRVIYKEFPIFGKTSELASQAALAAAMQGKYQQMHDALLKMDQRLDEKNLMEVAKSIGLNTTQLKKDMESSTVKETLAQNRQLAEKIHLMGTPAFVIAATPAGKFNAESEPMFIPGAATEEALQSVIQHMGS